MGDDTPARKLCLRCGYTKPVSEFGKCATKRDGLQTYCKVCKRQESRDWHSRNKEYRQAYNSNRSVAQSEYSREWYARNADRLNAHRRAKYAAALGLERQRGYDYTLRKPGHSTSRSRRRRAHLRGALVLPFTDEQLASRLSMWGGRCWICGSPAEHADHVKPIARGGPHVLANLRPACAPCNWGKNDSWPLTDELLDRLRRANRPSD